MDRTHRPYLGPLAAKVVLGIALVVTPYMAYAVDQPNPPAPAGAAAAHARTLSYYGIWHAEQGNVAKASDYLTRVRTACGNTTCLEYAALKEVIDGASSSTSTTY
jgi:hypothetical protein